MTKKLFVAGLPYSVNNDELGNHFAQFGQVTSAQVITDRATGRSKGFGFVEFSTEEEAAAAMEQLNNTDFGGRTIIVNEARPQEKREDGGRGGFNRGGGDRRDDNNRW